MFPFGYGLSYTTFDISAPRLSKTHIAAHESVDVEVDIVNTGTRTGDEVVQLYIRDDVSSVPRSVLELKGFLRVRLAPGEQRTVSLQLTPDSLAFWNINMLWIVEAGTFTVSVGPNCKQLKSTVLTVSEPKV